VPPGHRRAGLATAITVALADAAAGQGAARLYLQVEEDNTPAIALYARCGFSGHHGHHYRIVPGVLAWGGDPPWNPPGRRRRLTGKPAGPIAG